MGRIENYQQVINFIQENPSITGADLAREMGLAPRTARRYVSDFKSRLFGEKKVLNIQKNSIPVETNDAIVYDIEATDFKTDGYAGRLLCFSYMPLSTGKVSTLSLQFEDEGEDLRVLMEVARVMAQYRYRIGHNVAMFDDGWLNSRLMYYKLEPLDASFYFDTYQAAKSLAVKTSKGLGNLTDYFNLEGLKTTIYRTSWSKSMSQDRSMFDDAMKNIIFHCEHDVVSNRNLYDVLHWYAIKNGRNIPWKGSKFRGSYWYYEARSSTGT